MVTLFFIRHAESEANKGNFLAGQMDFPLSETGCAQADELGQELKVLPAFDNLFCSPLLRARQTAELIGKHLHLAPQQKPELIEQNLGRFSGQDYRTLDTDSGYCHDKNARWDWVPAGGGESYRMIAERLQPFFNWLDTRGPNERCIFITHAVTLRIIRGFLENSLPKYPPDISANGEIWEVPWLGFGKTHSIKSFQLGTIQTPKYRA